MLLKEKSRLEKEVVLGKKLKNTPRKDNDYVNQSINLITNQIDKLVELERTRNVSIKMFEKLE